MGCWINLEYDAYVPTGCSPSSLVLATPYAIAKRFPFANSSASKMDSAFVSVSIGGFF
ncbi:MAG TPA: hypothetical protein VEC43_00870 [Candidatus Acidoferrales bacterium]|nr:hypothetical protein [Candidatus Acidoferrales bacterium]